ncbi:hypothetical protein [Flavobacterium restrictum]|uniref:Uncharacterized protein n=1 Tax=Flavobacterium restrictum TaxID=2594428 RepID=A0A553DMT8_9FLAO|nr:hypothetical protein [Flavobacterium restrictum]TRX34088.1 hypothetical protein FNW21_15995 [Flavobacterium restrictum]
MENINELIDINLDLLSKEDNNSMFYEEFKDIQGNELHGTFHIQSFALEMEKRGLISINGSCCLITEFGLKIAKNKGWLNYLIDLESQKKNQENKNNLKEKLEIENIQLQNEASKYQKTIRDKEELIRNLTSDNLRLGNWDIRLRWYLAVLGFIMGFVTKYFIGK